MRMFTRSNPLPYVGTLCAVTCLLTAGASSNCQQPSNAPSTQGDAPAPMAFDNVSFYPDATSHDGQGFLWWACPYWMFSNVSSLDLIANAYGVGAHQVIGLPGWARTDRYALMAGMDREKYEAFKTLPMDEQLRQQRLMTQAVLADRYQLKAHYETREMPVYELVVAHGGLKLTDKVLEGRHQGASFFSPRDWYNNYGTMDDLANKLAGPTGGVVIDKTGLGKKAFFYLLKWASDSQGGAGGDPSIFKALEEQLGLKLIPATDPVEVLVIDRVEKPTSEFPRMASSGSSLY
jgi:uncharacterized protein (TIGR03435 family)